MAFQRTSVGIDIGSHAIKVVQLKITEKGAFIQNALYFDHANLVARGVDKDDPAAVADLLKAQMSDAGIPTKGVVLSISGSDSILRYTKVPPVPAWRLKAIMEYEVSEVAEKVGGSLASDFRLLPLPRDTDDDQVVLVGLAKEEGLQSLLTNLESSGITVAKAVPAPLALNTCYELFGPKIDPDSEDDDLAVLVDVGCTNLTTLLVLNGRIIFARSVSFGGDTFTQAVAKDFGIEHDRAEELKEKSGTVDLASVKTPQQETLVNALRGVAAQLQNLIQSSLRFSRTQVGVELPEPTKILLVGGGARLRGLTNYLEEALRKPVEVFHPAGVVATGKLEGDAAKLFASYPGDFSVPIGLAASGIRDAGFSMNILPQSYTDRRHFRQRTVFVYAAGIFLVLNLIFGLMNAYRQNSKADARAEELDSKRNTLEQYTSEMEESEQENARTRARINRIVREVEVTSFQSYFFDLLQAKLDPMITLKRVNVTSPLDDNEQDFQYGIVVEGIADDSNQLAVQTLESFRTMLAGEARVASATWEFMTSKGTTYEFKLAIRPSFQEQTF